MNPKANRRGFLAACGAVSASALSGCSQVRSLLPPNFRDDPELSLPAKVDEHGAYNVIIPGSDEGNVLGHLYQRSTGSLRMESDVGGVAEVLPGESAIQVEVDLTPDDIYASAGFRIGTWEIDQIAEIQFDVIDEIHIGLPLGIEYNGGTIAEWEEVDGMERRVGFDGDDSALTEWLSDSDSPITRSDEIWSSPPAGPAEFSGLSIDDLQSEYGNIPVHVAAFMDGMAGESHASVVERLDVIESS